MDALTGEDDVDEGSNEPFCALGEEVAYEKGVEEEDGMSKGD